MRNLIRSIFTLVLCICVGFGAFAQDAPKKKVAVYMTGDKVDETYKKVIGSKLVTAITESGEYAAVERTSDFLAAISAENDYQTSGEVRNNQIAALGQKFGVKYVVVADVSEVFDEFFIAARIINVETGLVDRACDVNGPAESMAQLIDLAKQVAQQLMTEAPKPIAVVGSTSPKNLSLCVKDNSSDKIYYISINEWKSLSEDQKNQYTKKGVCMIDDGYRFLVDLTVSIVKRKDVSKTYYLPSNKHFDIMRKYRDSLDDAMRAFGGDYLQVGGYWTNTRPKEYYGDLEAETSYWNQSMYDHLWIDVNWTAYCVLVFNLPN